jgi:hypothetical protein
MPDLEHEAFDLRKAIRGEVGWLLQWSRGHSGESSRSRALGAVLFCTFCTLKPEWSAAQMVYALDCFRLGLLRHGDESRRLGRVTPV